MSQEGPRRRRDESAPYAALGGDPRDHVTDSPQPPDPTTPAVPDEEVRELARRVQAVVNGLRRTASPDELRRLGGDERIGPRHLPVLFAVGLDEPIAVGAIAARLGVTLAAASLMVAELAGAGLVER